MKGSKRLVLLFIPILVCVCVLLLALYGLDCFLRPNRVTVRNLSGRTVANVTLELRSLDGDWKLTRHESSLPPGRSLRLRHSQNDTRGWLRFRIDDAEREHEETYIDLWTGEGWLLDIQPDGAVESGYDHRLRD